MEEKILIKNDLGEEVVGCPVLEFGSDREQTIRVDYGEHILDEGHVRRIIGTRDFSFEYGAKAGTNTYAHYMLRLACRYLEVHFEYPIDVQYIGLLPQVYPVKKKTIVLQSERDQKIYDICVNTLQLCMMEHYVDCPWREQCLYVFDSRNQMLCGYYAFENQNRDYARANLLLIAKDRRDDGLLSICYPCTTKLAIPSFSLHYITAVKEYIEATKDETLGEEVFEKISEIISVFASRIEDGLICRFGGEWLWNFYDWSEFCEGTLFHAQEKIPDLIINCLFIIALENFEYILTDLVNNTVESSHSSSVILRQQTASVPCFLQFSPVILRPFHHTGFLRGFQQDLCFFPSLGRISTLCDRVKKPQIFCIFHETFTFFTDSML